METSTYHIHLVEILAITDTVCMRTQERIDIAGAVELAHMHTDLTGDGTQQWQLLVGGWRDIDGMPRLPANRDLRNALGRYRLDRQFADGETLDAKRSTSNLFASSDPDALKRWARTAERPEVYERIPDGRQRDHRHIRLRPPGPQSGQPLERYDSCAIKALRASRSGSAHCFGTTKGQR